MKENLLKKIVNMNIKITILVILICVTVFFTVFCILIQDYKEVKENEELNNKTIENAIQVDSLSDKKNIDWNYLKTVNEDIIAWIEIEDTNINYPILKDNNLYYLKHSFDRRTNNNGSIFVTDIEPFIRAETVVYGHNMKNGTMFSSLGNYLKEDFLKSHLKFKIYTPNGDYEATIFSVYSIGISNENDNIKSLNFKDKIECYKSNSKFDIECDEDDIEKIVKLSTCSYINATTNPTDQRYYIIANLINI